MTYPRIVKPDASGPEPHISHDAVRAKLEMLLAKNPSAVMLLAEVGEEVHNDCLPDSGVLRRGMIKFMHEFFENPPQ